MKATRLLFLLWIAPTMAAALAGCARREPRVPQAAAAADTSAPGEVSPGVAALPLTAPSPRDVRIIVDVSKSNSLQDVMTDTVVRLVEAASPGDRYLIARLAGTFVPARDVVEAYFPVWRPELIAPAANFPDWQQRQALLVTFNRDQQARRQALKADLGRLLALRAEKPGTLVHEVLRYVAEAPSPLPDATRLVIICSDLYDDDPEHRISTQRPPLFALPFQDTRILSLFVPDLWREGQTREAWESYFKNQCGAAEAALVEAALSKTHPLPLSPWAVPRVVPRMF